MTVDMTGKWCLVKIKGVKNQQIMLRDELQDLTAKYTVMCTGSYAQLEKAVYDELKKRSREHNK